MLEYVFKIIIVGDSGVGKTTAIKRFIEGGFVSDTKAIIGMNFSFKQLFLNLNDSNNNPVRISLHIWDTGGEQRFRDILRFNMKGTKGLIIAFDGPSLITFESLSQWLELIKLYIDFNSIPAILISTKYDLKTEINTNLLKPFLRKYNISEYYPTSAVTGKNIKSVFKKLCRLMINKTSL